MNNYSFIQIFLHDLVLDNNLIKKSLYEIEKFFFLKKLKFIKMSIYLLQVYRDQARLYY